MVFFRTITIFGLIVGFFVIGLSGCTSKTDAFTLKANQERWFCTPLGEDDWTCQESSRDFEQLEQHNKRAQSEPEQKLESSDTDTSSVSSTFVVKGATRELEQGAERLSNQEVSAQDSSSQENSSQENSSQENSSQEIPVQETPVQKAVPAQLEGAEFKSESASSSNADRSNDEHNGSWPVAISPWVVQLGAYGSMAAADELVQKVGKGEVFKTQVKGRFYFTVVVTGFSQKFEAEQSAREIETRPLGISPWVRQGASLQKFLVD
ncbi:SPOR domain-containing protein [Kangiella geojedonensis]|uniref:SPOR domain-containing protein n=1 Tax=Kangiella geojedonensis TaxID=914150 RepID=A0A0F6RBU7_9GAMM|nr:SPOR domain-containing protein [Kangiella geojedonensis]AKE51476.1 hypothetical protein TQ33_0492 [Kangiella geojedonensis]